MINPDGVRHQIHGNVIQSTSRALMEEVAFEASSVASREWGAYPIIKFPDIPKIDVLMLPRQDQPPMGVGKSASVPSAAAIANAIFDATGVRFREPPFTPEKIRAGLGQTAPTRPIMLAPTAPSHQHEQRNPFAKPLGLMSRSPRSVQQSSALPQPCCLGARSRRSHGLTSRLTRPQRSRAGRNWRRSAIARCATPL